MMTGYRKNTWFLGLIVPLLFWGCAKKPMVKSSISVAPSTSQAENPKQETPDVEASIRGKEFSVAANLQTVYFDYDSSDIRLDMGGALVKNAEFFKSNPNVELRVDGHCDDRGTTEYNIALGQKRASAIRAYYKSLGVPGDRIGTLSWGEEKTTCSDLNETCWSKNRRAETLVRSTAEVKSAKPKAKSK